jgi:hypothetical protein
VVRIVRALSLCLAALSLLAASGCGGPSRQVVARVDTHAITRAMLEHWIAVLAVADRAAASDRLALRRHALGLLIWWQWLASAAAQLHVRVTGTQAEKQLALFTFDHLEGRRFEWFADERALTSYVFNREATNADRLLLVAMGLLAARLEAGRVAEAKRAVSPTRIRAYYERNKHHLIRPERRDIEAIMNYDESKVAQAKRELQAGRSFASVAARFNQSGEGGLKRRITRLRGGKRYEKDFFSARAHVLVGPVKERLYYVFEVLRIVRGGQETLAQSEAKITQRLAVHDASTELLPAFERRWAAKTRCAPGYVVARCGRQAAAP